MKDQIFKAKTPSDSSDKGIDKSMKQTIAFIGLGTMGYPMAGHLAESAHPVIAFNRTRKKAEKWHRAYRGIRVESLSEAASQADIIISCLGNDDDVREVYSALFTAASAGTILIDHTTTSAELARELGDRASNLNMHFLDAPVSGGQIGAQQGTLTVMAGGDASVYAQIKPIMQCYAKNTALIGPQGYGQLCKMINQICVAGVLQGLSEGLQLAKAHGIKAETIVGTLGQGAASSWQMIHRTETMLRDEFDFGFAIDWMRKDLAICFAEAAKLGIELPMSQRVDQCYASLQKRGYSRSDTSALIKQFD